MIPFVITMSIFLFTEVVNLNSNQEQHESSNTLWATPCLEDPLKLPDPSSQDDGNILSSFLNNNDQAKAFGLNTAENEFISLDRLDDRNRNALVSRDRYKT